MAAARPLDDREVERFIETHKDGATVIEIAAVVGCSHQRIQQLLAKALRKVAVALQQRGLTLDDLI